MSDIYFSEVQRVRQAWIWLLLAAILGLWLWQLVQQVIMGIPFGNNPAPDLVVVLIGIIPCGTMVLLVLLKLETHVDRTGISYRMWPFHNRFRVIKVEEIIFFEVKKYHPIRDYGGWGIRWGLKGTAYNMSGDQGAYFELRSGKRILIGTRRPEELRAALGKCIKESIQM